MTHSKLGMIVLVIMLPLATACSTLYEGKYDYSDGWRAAIVEQLSTQRDGLSFLIQDDHPERVTPTVDNTFALVTYRVLKGKRKRIVKIPALAPVQTGDTVYINIRDTTLEAVLPTRHKN